MLILSMNCVFLLTHFHVHIFALLHDGSRYDRLGLKRILAPILRQNLKDTHFLASTLWPNNSSLHPPILYGLFKDWDGGTFLFLNPLSVCLSLSL
jgi:hypothetical protein